MSGKFFKMDFARHAAPFTYLHVSDVYLGVPYVKFGVGCPWHFSKVTQEKERSLIICLMVLFLSHPHHNDISYAFCERNLKKLWPWSIFRGDKKRITGSVLI